MSPTNVLYVIDTMKIGGAQRHLIDVVHDLDPRRFRPQVCVLGPATTISRDLEKNGISVHTLQLENIYDRKAVRAFRKLVRLIRENQIDLVHSYLPSSNVFGSLAARLGGVSAVLTTRRDMGFSRSWRMALLEQLVVNPMAKRVIAVCDAVAREACREWFLSPPKVVTIYNGIDLERIPGESHRNSQDVREQLGVSDGRPVVTIVASFSPVKAHEVFLEAAACIRQTEPSVVFVLVGDGPRRAACEQLVCQLNLEESVRLVGELSTQRTRDVLGATDIGVLTSVTEGMSNALLEFMAFAKPVVATRIGGNPEVVVEGRTGLLVPPLDSAAVAEAVSALLHDPRRAAEMGRAGRSRIETLFTVRQTTDALESLYEDVLET